MLNALFPQTRQRVLEAILLGPQERWTLSDLARHLHVRPSSLQRELASLTNAELLAVSEEGPRRYYRPHPVCPILSDLKGLLVKTGGVTQAVAHALAPALPRTQFAFIFGSCARGERRAGSDLDLMLIGAVSLPEIALELRALERELGIPVNAVTWSEEEFRRQAKQGHHFLTSVLGKPKVFLKGCEDELADFVGIGSGSSAYNKPSGNQ